MGLLGSIGGIFSSGINALSQKSTNNANLELAKMQNDWNEHMWERNNAYNTPTAQVGRLLDAGINPLGQNFTSYQSSPVQSADLANQQAPQLDTSSIVQGFQGDRNLDIQEKLADAEVKLKGIQGITEAKRAGLIDSQKAEQDYKNKYADDTYRYQRDNAKWLADLQVSNAYIRQLESTFRGSELAAGVRRVLSASNLDDAQAAFVDEQRKWYPKLSEAEIKLKVATAFNQQQQGRHFQRLVYELKETFGIRQKMNEAQLQGLIAAVYDTYSSVNIKNIDAFMKALEANKKRFGLDGIKFGTLDVGGAIFGGLMTLDILFNKSKGNYWGQVHSATGNQSYMNPYSDNNGIPKPFWQE